MSFTLNGLPAPQVASWLVGVAPAMLQAWLTDAQAAYQQLATGFKPSVVLYGQGDGNKSVTYTRTNQAMLLAHINQLQAALGTGRPRRAIGVRFG